jgi:archaellum component FlaC
MPFWCILAVFLLVIPAIFVGIVTMWQFFRQKISDKIADDLSAHDTKTYNAELGRINAEIGRINARDDDFTKEAQKILSMVNNITARLNTIEEACCNNFGRFTADFTSINSSVEALQNEMIRHYAESKPIS